MRILSSLAAVIVLVSACSNSNSPSASGPKLAAERKTEVSTSTVKLAKGMPAADVIKALGEPTEKKVIKTPSGEGQVWIYRRALEEAIGYIPTNIAMQERVMYSEVQTKGGLPTPVTAIGQNVSLGEQYRRVAETTSLLIIGDQLIEWDRVRKEGVSYVR